MLLEAPDPASPRDLYGTEDARRLGVFVTELRLVPAAQPGSPSPQADSASGGAKSGMSSGSSGTGGSP